MQKIKDPTLEENIIQVQNYLQNILIRTQIQYNKSLKANDKSLEWYDLEREI